MTELISADRGVNGISQLRMGPAGDVGLAVEFEAPGLECQSNIGDALRLTLLSGQEFDFSVDAIRVLKTGSSQATVLQGHDAIYALSRTAPSREQIFVTLSQGEYEQYVAKTRNLKPNYDIHIMVGDQFGRRGWSSLEVAQGLGALAGLSDVVVAVVPQWIRQVVCRPSTSFLDALLHLFRIQEPVIWVRDSVLFVMDRALASSFADGAPTVSNGLLASRIVAGRALPTDGLLRLEGGLGKFRPDRYCGRTWTSPVNLGSAVSKADLSIRSPLLKSMLSHCKCFGGYEFDDGVERGESEVRMVKELWLKDVLGSRHLLLFSQERVYRTPECVHWSGDSARCNLSLRCNGKGTAVCCGWYRSLQDPSEEAGSLIRCEETLHLYEHTPWDVETPREYASHTVISAWAWVNGTSRGAANTQNGLSRVWLDPIEYQVRSFTYDGSLGTLEEQTTQKREAVYSVSCDCDWSSGNALEGGCLLGQTTCDFWDTPCARCRLGLACNEFGRLATCPEYTGLSRTCKAGDGSCYDPGCPDCTVGWRRLQEVRSASEIPEDAVIKTQLVGNGSNFPRQDGDNVSPEGVDPECVVYQESVRCQQVDAMTYRRTVHTLRLLNGRVHSRTEAHNVPAASVPSHPVTLRKMHVFAQKGEASGPVCSEPMIERQDSNLVDWGDAENTLQRLYENLSKSGAEDVYELPGELHIQPGAPLIAPSSCDSELPSRPDSPGLVQECSLETSSSDDGTGRSVTKLRVKF